MHQKTSRIEETQDLLKKNFFQTACLDLIPVENSTVTLYSFETSKK